MKRYNVRAVMPRRFAAAAVLNHLISSLPIVSTLPPDTNFSPLWLNCFSRLTGLTCLKHLLSGYSSANKRVQGDNHAAKYGVDNSHRSIAMRWPHMSWHTSIEVVQRALIVVRQARQAEDRAALVHAAHVSSATMDRGCEQFIAFDERPGVSIMLTSFVGERSIHTHPPCSFAGVLAFGNQMHTTLDSIHHGGTTHGGIMPRRIVLGAHGEPVLCNFLHGSRRSDVSSATWNSRVASDRNTLATVVAHLYSVVPEPRSTRNLHCRRRIDRLLTSLRSNGESTGSRTQDASVSFRPLLMR